AHTEARPTCRQPRRGGCWARSACPASSGGGRGKRPGRIAEGFRADPLLVDGGPTSNISDTLNTRAVWCRGTRLAA
ncbi:hypothetical protein ACFU99_41045, partial [Streptomyces sp. NPDC057654]|uniref:hypothetical protein n=1 Tax=Streptomyces sp. NPDC057654 TaxID=3346196 RepID=UPI003691E77F